MKELQRGNSYGSIENPFWLNLRKMLQAGSRRPKQCLAFDVHRTCNICPLQFFVSFWQNLKKKTTSLQFANGCLRKAAQRSATPAYSDAAGCKVRSEGRLCFSHVINFPLASFAQCPPRSLCMAMQSRPIKHATVMYNCQKYEARILWRKPAVTHSL